MCVQQFIRDLILILGHVMGSSNRSMVRSITVILIIIFYLDPSSTSLADIISYGSHHHHAHHHPPHHKCRYTVPPPPPPPLPSSSLSSFETSMGADRFDSNGAEELIPLKVEYTLPMDYDQMVSKEIEVRPLFQRHNPIGTEPYRFRSWDDDSSSVFRVKKTRNKKKKKKIIPIKDVYYQELVDITKHNDQPMNKILVIEEPDTNLSSKSKQEIDSSMEKQIVKTIINSPYLQGNRENPINHQIDHHPPNNSPYERPQFMPQPQSIPNHALPPPPPPPPPTTTTTTTSAPILTIKDLHDRLNHTLLSNLQNSGLNKNFHMVPSSSYNQTFSVSGGTNYGSQDLYAKSNNYAYQNSWNPMFASNDTADPIGFRSGNYTNKTNEQMELSGSINRQWFKSSTTPKPLVYFTSHRSVIPTPTMRPTPIYVMHKKKADTVDYDNPNKFFASKTGSQQQRSSNDGNKIDENNANSLDLGKISSIIVAFCILMMLLTGVIVMILHKDTVSDHIRSIADRIDPRRTDSNEEHGETTNNGSNQPRNDQPSRSSTSSGSSSDFNRSSPIAIPEPPPPPPKPFFPTSSEHRFEINPKFTTDKSRKYFSRVHRWSPKRPPLPTDLLKKDQTTNMS